jgi:RNA polymerase sigma-70 factor (ECF subfamily)
LPLYQWGKIQFFPELLLVFALDEKLFGNFDVEQLFRELYPALVAYAVRFSGDVHTARDLVQDTFAAVWQNKDQIQVQTGVRSYMYQAVRNRALNYLRDHRFTESLDEQNIDVDEAAVFAGSDLVSSPGDASSEADKMKLLKEWIDNLPERQKEAFELSRFDGLTHREISTVMGISEKTVNNHLIAAMKSIKQMHDDYKKP